MTRRTINIVLGVAGMVTYYTGLDLGWFIRRRRYMSRKARDNFVTKLLVNGEV